MSTLSNDPLAFLVDWYVTQRDDDWEHDAIPLGTYWGIEISTISNPGWSLDVRLEGTDLEGWKVEWTKLEESDHQWLHWRSTGSTFEARCGARDLPRALAAFQSFVTARRSGESGRR